MTENRVLPGCEVRDIDDQRHEVQARILSYGEADAYGTVWKPGCFGELRSVPACLHHDLTKPFGRVTGFRDSPRYLDCTIRFASTRDVPSAREAWSLISDGTLDGFSVTFDRRSSSPVPTEQRNRFGDWPAKEYMHKAKLVEVSAVAAPAVAHTGVLAMRNLIDLDSQLASIFTRSDFRAARRRAEGRARYDRLAAAVALEQRSHHGRDIGLEEMVDMSERIAQVL